MASQSQVTTASLPDFDPLVAEWFGTRFGTPTEPQILGWPAIREGHDVLISAPTGSGKTLAAFLASDAAAWVTGATLHVNGGMAML